MPLRMSSVCLQLSVFRPTVDHASDDRAAAETKIGPAPEVTSDTRSPASQPAPLTHREVVFLANSRRQLRWRVSVKIMRLEAPPPSRLAANSQETPCPLGLGLDFCSSKRRRGRRDSGSDESQRTRAAYPPTIVVGRLSAEAKSTGLERRQRPISAARRSRVLLSSGMPTSRHLKLCAAHRSDTVIPVEAA